MKASETQLVTTILQHILQQPASTDLTTWLSQVPSAVDLASLVDEVTMLLSQQDDPVWLEAIAAAKEGTITPLMAEFLADQATLGELDPDLLAQFAALQADPATDLLADLPAFATFAQQQTTATEGEQADWLEVALAQGKAWVEQATGTWRKVSLSLAALTTPPTASPALSGLMRADSAAAPQMGASFTLAPDEANFELTATLLPTDQAHCNLEVIVTLFDRLGDFSGVELTLSWGDQAITQTTDDQGEAVFADLPCAEVPTIQLWLDLPAS